MRVLILYVTVITAAVSCTSILPREWPNSSFCTPNSVYSASTEDVYGGGTCRCNNDGSSGNCWTVYSGSSFSFTQTSSDKRGNLRMCLTHDTCFEVPRKKNLPNRHCQPLIQPELCWAEQNGKTFEFIVGLDDDFVDGSVKVNGITYQILPIMFNGRRRVYL